MRKILIIEDIAETRAWLTEIVLQAYPSATVDQTATVAQALALIPRVYDLALIDLGLPDGSGLDVVREMRAAQMPTLCVVTTVIGEDSSVVSALSAGADGYLLKEYPAAVLARQLDQISHGIPALSPSIARRIMDHFRFTGPAATEPVLTDRESEVLALIGRGLRNTEVAQHLNIAETTVAGHIKSVYRKLGISSRAEAAWHATRMGLRS